MKNKKTARTSVGQTSSGGTIAPAIHDWIWPRITVIGEAATYAPKRLCFDSKEAVTNSRPPQVNFALHKLQLLVRFCICDFEPAPPSASRGMPSDKNPLNFPT